MRPDHQDPALAPGCRVEPRQALECREGPRRYLLSRRLQKEGCVPQMPAARTLLKEIKKHEPVSFTVSRGSRGGVRGGGAAPSGRPQSCPCPLPAVLRRVHPVALGAETGCRSAMQGQLRGSLPQQAQSCRSRTYFLTLPAGWRSPRPLQGQIKCHGPSPDTLFPTHTPPPSRSGPEHSQVPQTCPARAADQQCWPPAKMCHHPTASILLREGRPLLGGARGL